MTDTTAPAPTPEPPDNPRDADAPDERSPANQEAAKYRTRAREAQQALEATQAQLAAARLELLRTALPAIQVNKGMTFNIAALDDAGLNLDELFAEDGKLDTDAVTTSLTALAEARPYMFKAQERMIVPLEGHMPERDIVDDTFTAAFAPKPM